MDRLTIIYVDGPPGSFGTELSPEEVMRLVEETHKANTTFDIPFLKVPCRYKPNDEDQEVTINDVYINLDRIVGVG